MGLDLRAPFGDDIVLFGKADVQVLGNKQTDVDPVTAREELIQRIIYRLLTNPGEWLAFPDYGAGLRLKVNETITPQLIGELKSTIRQQLLKEPDVQRTPAPEVNIGTINDGLLITIKVYSIPIGFVSFTFDPSLNLFS